AQQIQFSQYDHPVVMTVEAQSILFGTSGIRIGSAKYVGHIKAGLSKNLFLKDKKHRYYIVSALADTKVDLKVLSQRLGLGKGGLRMAPEEAVSEILEVLLVHVTIFAFVSPVSGHLFCILRASIIGDFWAQVEEDKCCFAQKQLWRPENSSDAAVAQTPYLALLTIIKNYLNPTHTKEKLFEVPLGSVTPFALVNESARNVSLLLDQGFKTHECCFFHPLSNDTSITLKIQDLYTFLKSVERMVAYVDLEANPTVGKDQPPDLAALVPSDTPSIQNISEKTATLQIDGDVKSKPVVVTAKASKVSSGQQKEKPVNTANSSSSFADPEQFIEEIFKKASAIVVAEIKEENIKQHGDQLGAVVSDSIRKNLTLEFKNLATMFKNTAYTEGFGAGIRCPAKRL
ncbi:hypothetical protein M8C21_023140, partial [Ambrosia artemisiifolia]